MATPSQKLAESLEKLREIQDEGIVGVKANDLSRVHRERLVENGFLQEVIKGWYVSTPQDERKGDSTSWYVSFWGFCSRYLQDRYDKEYCLSAEQSLSIHAGNNSIPNQLIVRSQKGNNMSTDLIFDTSIFVMKSTLPENAGIEEWKGLRIVSLPSAIIHCTPSFFKKNPTDVRAALMMIKDASELLGILLDGGHSRKAGRIAGAYRNMGRGEIADNIIKTMGSVGYDIREMDPFDEPTPIRFKLRENSPHVNRLKLMWLNMRDQVIQVFPEVPGIRSNKNILLEQIEELYTTDAYHSLSIEKYSVTPGMIERVRLGTWDAEGYEEDRKQKDAMAARGYWQAFNAVKKSLRRIIDGENSGLVVNQEHGDWYRELFSPSVAIGLLKPSDLAGYRNDQVYIGQSKHTPPDKDAVRDLMPLLFELLKSEKHPGVRAVLGHFVFVYTHPYMDGNGRMGRFLMNAMLVSGGYPWTVIPVEQRDVYMSALESASVGQDIVPFAEFIASLVESGLQGRPVANLRQFLNT